MLVLSLPLIFYVLVSTFTPGPSNITSASLGILHGYRQTLRYQGGLAAGVFVMMALSGLLSATLVHMFPALEPLLRYIGAGYMLYLAAKLLRASYMFAESESESLAFRHGILLQVLNPKLFVYAFTVFTAFLAPLTNNEAQVVAAAGVLAAVSFAATSVWALFGAAIKAVLRKPRVKAAVNVLLAVSLVYAAVALLFS